MRRVVTWAALGLIGLFVLIKVVPYGHDHRNPPVRAEPAWDSTRTRALAERACFACHGNTTAWPWYSNVAHVSWYVQHDVDEARRKLNFSEWDRPQREAGDAADAVREG